MCTTPARSEPNTIVLVNSKAEAIPRRRWRIAVLLGFGVLVNYFDRVNLSVSREALTQQFGITTITFGYLLSAYSWTYAAMQIPSGVILDRLGVRRVIRGATLLWSIASFFSAVSTGVGSFFCARLLLGIGEAPTFPGNAKAVGYWFPNSERSLATAIFDAAAKFASAIGVPVMALLIVHFGWRRMFALTAAASFAYFLAFYFVYRNPGEDAGLSEEERAYIAAGGAQSEKPVQGLALGYLLKQRKVWGLSLGSAAYNYCFYLLLTWLPSYLSAELHIDLLHSAFYTAIPWLVATFTDLLVGGWLVDALIQRGYDANRVRQSILVGGTVLGLGIFGAAGARSISSALFWISLSLGGLAAAAPVGWSVPSLIAPRGTVGQIGGIANFCSQLAAISAPIFTGYVVSATHSFSGAFVLAAGILLIGIFGYVALLGRIEPIPEPAR
ncbi:MAG TPA: MFS transporter [Terriglobales bacterium]|nr:MFS transporter [Terriglobales bacterium]